jgi:prolyl-tRNA synthetase
MLAAAIARRDAFVTDCTTLEEVREVTQAGVARMPWAAVGTAGERELAGGGITVRCLQLPDGSLPEVDDASDAVAYLARAY